MVVLYNFHLILGQKQPQQAPLQIAAGSQFVPKTNECTIQLPITPGTNAVAAHPFMVLQPNVLLIPGTTSLKAPEKKALVVRVHSAYFEVDQLNVSLATPFC